MTLFLVGTKITDDTKYVHIMGVATIAVVFASLYFIYV